MKARTAGVISLTALLAGWCAIGRAAQISSPTQAANATGLPGISGSGGSFTPGFSADGQAIVFVSLANNLVTNDDSGSFLDIFVARPFTGPHVLVSVNSSGAGGGDGNSGFPTISSNGQLVAFESGAGNLAGNDTNGCTEVFVRDLDNGVTTLVSINTNGTSSGNGESSAAVISSDGRWIVFASSATDLVAGDTNGIADLFLHDRKNGVTTRLTAGAVNASTDPFEPATSHSAALTPTGSRVAFVSTATNLVPNVTNRWGEIYVRDVASEETLWASTNVSTYIPGAVACFNPVLSDDGRFVAFKARAYAAGNNLNSVLLFRHDLETGETILVASNSFRHSWPAISSDGRLIVSETSSNVYLWDVNNGTNLLVSVDASGTAPGNGSSFGPVPNPDFSRIAFLSDASNLHTNPSAAPIARIYVRDLAAAETLRIGGNPPGATAADLRAATIAFGGNGLVVAFDSADDDLVADDRNRASDVFLFSTLDRTTGLLSHHLPGKPSVTPFALVGQPDRSGISADGRYVVFSASDGNCIEGDTNGFVDVFLRDLLTGSNLLVSANLSGALANGASRDPVLSANGRFVAFVSEAADLLTVSNTARKQVFLRDLLNGVTSLVSLNQDATGGGNGDSFGPSISADGGVIAYESRATDLVGGLNDGNQSVDVFARVMTESTNRPVSIALSGDKTGDNVSTNPEVTADGRWILFASRASDLTPSNTGGIFSLLARDLWSQTTEVVSVGATGNPQMGFRGRAAVSANSRTVAFAGDNYPGIVRDLLDRASTNVCTGCANFSISGDGRYAVYEKLSFNANPTNIWTTEVATGATNLISVNHAGSAGGNGSSFSPLITYDGQYVIFASVASDLVEGDTNEAVDIFVRDVAGGVTLLISRSATGTGRGPSLTPVLGADGRSVLFQSFAPDLVTDDFNGNRDLFLLRLGGGDSDGDGMDDDAELAYFGTLSRDGSGDFDGDGESDADELLACTNPADDASIFRVLNLSRLGGGETILYWAAFPGKTYRVQYKTNAGDPAWNDFQDTVIATASTATFTDHPPPGEAHRFYRVLAGP